MAATSARFFAATMFALTSCAPLRYLNRPPDGDLGPPTTVQIANETTRSYRVSLVVGTTVALYDLGTVAALETREFTLSRIAVRAYGEAQLVATPRTGAGRRDSDRFTLTGATTVKWTIDAAMSRAVLVR